MTDAQAGTLSLTLTHTFNASRERVWQAWTTAEQLAQWFHPNDDLTTTVHRYELRVGGRYRIEMANAAAGASYVAIGEFREITEGELLAFSWRWESDAPDDDTLVTVEFRDNGERTDVTLIHSGFATEQARSDHEQGWKGCNEVLAKHLAG